jgi:hypothetical protein
MDTRPGPAKAMSATVDRSESGPAPSSHRSPAGLSSQTTDSDHALRQRRRSALVLLELLIQRIANRLKDVKADEIAQREHTRRATGTEFFIGVRTDVKP